MIASLVNVPKSVCAKIKRAKKDGTEFVLEIPRPCTTFSVALGSYIMQELRNQNVSIG